MHNTFKIAYWITTLILCVLFLYAAQMYLFNLEMVIGFFTALNYPIYIIISLAILKTLVVCMMLYRKPLWLAEWAYAGFFFDLVLASAAHYKADHGIGLSAIAIPVLFISYFLGKQVRT